jgi:hypothetical protein
MRRRILLAACALLLAAPLTLATNAGGSTSRHGSGKSSRWAQAEIRFVVSHGLMARSVARFRASAPLTQGELATLVSGLTRQPVQPPADPGASVTVAQLDARLVRAIQLSPTAAELLSGARAAGLRTPSRFGTETVARLLGLRTNHPAKDDDLELLPSDPVTRAETAYSVAKILRFRGGEQQYAEDAAATFALPELTTW